MALALDRMSQGRGDVPFRTRGLNSYLIAIVIVALLPVMVAALTAVWWAATAFRDASTNQLLETARTVAQSVRNELEINSSIFKVLSQNSRLNVGNVFVRALDLNEIARQFDGRVILSDSHQARNPSPIGRYFSDGSQVNIDAVFDGQSNVVFSDLFARSGDDKPSLAIAIAAPQPVGGKRRPLILVASADRLVRTLQNSSDASMKTLIAVTDSTGHIIARSREPQKFIGRNVPDWSHLKAVGGSHGYFEAKTIEGKPIMFGFQRISDTPGWMVVVGEPLGEFNARWINPVLWLIAVGVAAALVALGMALWLSRLILLPIRALATRAQITACEGISVPGNAQPINVPSSPVREFEMLRQNLESSEAALRRQATELARSELRYRSLAEAGTLVFWTRDPEGNVRDATGWQDLTGQSESEALGSGWILMVHPEDRAAVESAWQNAIADRKMVDIEFRIQAKTGSWRWVRERGTCHQEAEASIPEWIGVLECIDERRQAERHIFHLAHHDALTGLSNRIVFRQTIEETIAAAANGRVGAVHLIDLDRFKAVNDTFGHPAGDALLIAVTERLRTLVADDDIVARLGGDEFAVIQRHVGRQSDAARFANRIVQQIGVAYLIDGNTVEIGASVGTTMIVRDDEDPDQVLKDADVALYRAKSNGRSQHQFHHSDRNNRYQDAS